MHFSVPDVNTSWKKELQQNSTGWVMMLLVTGMLVLGLIALYSVGRSKVDSSSYYLIRQCVWVGLGMILFVVVSRIPSVWLRKISIPAYLGGLFLLVLTLLPGLGDDAKGAQRWLLIGPVRFQPSELFKVAYVLFLAEYLAQNQREMRTFVRGFLLPCVYIAVPFLLILKEPDYGTAFLVALVGGMLIFLAGARLKFLIPCAVLGIVLFGIAISMDAVRSRRILSFLDVEGNKSDGSYQLHQAVVAFGVGGIDGVGVGNGRQQLNYLPEAHTDFIFPIIGEELGLIFTSLTVVLFLGLFLLIIMRVRHAPNLHQFIIVMGSGLFIVLQSLINLGVVTGCLPTKGMSLPFFSYGGSNMVTMFLFLGILLNSFRSWNRFPLTSTREVIS
jgi:cell division protein FtsW